MQIPIVLASQSPRRQELLGKITPVFTVDAPHVDETFPENLPPSQIPAFLARKKAAAIRDRYPDAIIIGCDTIIHFEGELLGKPENRADAKRMLTLLSGNTHQVYTGCAVFFPSREEEVFVVDTDVSFAKCSPKEIDAYLITGEADDKAGAYGIQGMAARFITGISGDYYSVMGFPLSAVYQLLKPYL